MIKVDNFCRSICLCKASDPTSSYDITATDTRNKQERLQQSSSQVMSSQVQTLKEQENR